MYSAVVGDGAGLALPAGVVLALVEPLLPARVLRRCRRTAGTSARPRPSRSRRDGPGFARAVGRWPGGSPRPLRSMRPAPRPARCRGTAARSAAGRPKSRADVLARHVVRQGPLDRAHRPARVGRPVGHLLRVDAAVERWRAARSAGPTSRRRPPPTFRSTCSGREHPHQPDVVQLRPPARLLEPRSPGRRPGRSRRRSSP